MSSLYWKEVLGVDGEKERQENAIEYYTQRANYLEGGVTITGKAPSKTERKQSSRQLAATRKQLISELNGGSEKKAKRRKKAVEDGKGDFSQQKKGDSLLHNKDPSQQKNTTSVNATTSQPTSDSSSKTEAQRRVDALLRLAGRSASETPAKKSRRKRKEDPPPRLSWETNLKPLLSSSVIDMDASAFAELLRKTVTRESSFCCVLNDGSLSYQVSERSHFHRRAGRRFTMISFASSNPSPSSSCLTERSR